MKLKVVVPHISNYPDPIEFKTGEILQVGERDTEFEGWVKVTTLDGNEGWAPEQYIDESKNSAIATSDYSARELNTVSGEILAPIYFLNEWAWVKNSEGNLGWVPLNTTIRM